MRPIDADALLKEMVGITDGWLKPPKDWKWYEDSVRNAPTVSGWVSVKDGLPDKPCSCLVFNIYGWRTFDRWEGYGWVWANESEVTHWMPLPEPPKEDEKHGR